MFWDFIFWFLSNIIEIVIVCFLAGLAWLGFIQFCKWRINNRISQLEDFTVSHKLISEDGKTAIVLDDKTKRICCFTDGRTQPIRRILKYSDLIAVDLTRQGESVTTTSTASQVGRGIVGGLALGGLGALAGGLSGEQKHTHFTKRIALLLTFNDVDNPHLAVAVSDSSAKTGGLLDNIDTKKANEWLSRLQVIVKNNEKK